MKAMLDTIFSAMENETSKTYEWQELCVKLVILSTCIYALVKIDSAIYNYLVG